MKDLLMINPLFFQLLATQIYLVFFCHINPFAPWFIWAIAVSLSMYQEDKRKEENDR